MSEELDLKQILRYCYQRKVILAIIIVISLILGLLYTFSIKQKVYKVSTIILIDKADASIQQFLNSKDIIQSNMNVEFDKNSKLVTITVEKQEQEEAFNTINQYIGNIQTKLQEIYGIKNFKIIENPEFPQQVTNTEHIKDILISVLIGIFIDIAYIIICLSFMGITNIYEIEQNLNVKALGYVGFDKRKNKNLYITKDEKIQYQIKRIQANLLLNKENQKAQTILLTATKKGEGASYVTINLANQYSKLNLKTLIIDANIENKTITNIMAKENEGLTDIIIKNNIGDMDKLIQETKIENVFILPAGKMIIEEELIFTKTIVNIVENVKKKYNTILIDSSSINESIIPIRLANIADTTILISETGRVMKEDIVKSKTVIENVSGNIAGIVLNKSI